MSDLGRITTNNLLWIYSLRRLPISSLSIDSKKFLVLDALMPGVHDIRARIGTFNNPWGATVPAWYAPPALTFIQDKLCDILDARAIELINTAKKQNKNLVINWSGGTDSTTVLVSFLKNVSKEDQHLITVCCNTTSVIEYLEFYLNYILPNNAIQIKTSNTLVVSTDYLDNNILIHGDPADCLFGPSTGMYTYFSTNGQHLEPWRKHSTKMIELMDQSLVKQGLDAPQTGAWWFDIMTRTLEESGQSDYISTVADWWWWTYFNFKWPFSCQRLLFLGLAFADCRGLPEHYQQSYAENTFFNTAKFQQWSFSNLKQLVGPNVFKTHKAEAKQYIYNFTKDSNIKNKIKKASQHPLSRKYKTSILGYDKDYVPVYNSPNTLLLIQTLLQRWKEQR